MTDAGGTGGGGRLEALLEVQQHDTAVDRLVYRRAHLPEREELAAAGVRARGVRERLSALRDRREEVLGRQAKLEGTIAGAGERIKEIEARLYSGQVTATRDIMAMTAEVESLKARRSSLEDDLLAAMEEDEPLAVDAAALEAAAAALEAEAARIRVAIAEAEQVIDAEMAVEEGARAGHAASVPDTLLATYEKLRAKLGGVGAARLVGASCSGCHLTLPVQAVARIKREPPDALVQCEQCGRILVH